MIKHLLISITFVLMFVGCNGWFVPCCETTGQYCLSDSCSPVGGGGDDDDEVEGDGCNGDGGGTWFYMWIVTEGNCQPKKIPMCEADIDAATAYVDANYDPNWHGPISEDPNANQPLLRQVCASGASCTVGASDGSLASQFWVFTDEQLQQCEQWLDSQCSWAEADPMTGACPAVQ